MPRGSFVALVSEVFFFPSSLQAVFASRRSTKEKKKKANSDCPYSTADDRNCQAEFPVTRKQGKFYLGSQKHCFVLAEACITPVVGNKIGQGQEFGIFQQNFVSSESLQIDLLRCDEVKGTKLSYWQSYLSSKCLFKIQWHRCSLP